MTTAKPVALHEAAITEISQETHLIRAYRERLGYAIDDVAVTSGLTVGEIALVEAGHRFEKGYRERIARALGLPEGIFDKVSDVPDAA